MAKVYEHLSILFTSLALTLMLLGALAVPTGTVFGEDPSECVERCAQLFDTGSIDYVNCVGDCYANAGQCPDGTGGQPCQNPGAYCVYYGLAGTCRASHNQMYCTCGPV